MALRGSCYRLSQGLCHHESKGLLNCLFVLPPSEPCSDGQWEAAGGSRCPKETTGAVVVVVEQDSARKLPLFGQPRCWSAKRRDRESEALVGGNRGPRRARDRREFGVFHQRGLKVLYGNPRSEREGVTLTPQEALRPRLPRPRSTGSELGPELVWPMSSAAAQSRPMGRCRRSLEPKHRIIVTSARRFVDPRIEQCGED
jgi:hypothetical protein